MSRVISKLIEQLPSDTWRAEVGFSDDLEEATNRLLASGSEEQQAQILSGWLQRSQPCLFGRAGAALGLMHYCVLTPTDLAGDDEHVRNKIQTERRAWRRAAFEGRESGFVILALSDRIATASPGIATQRLAQQLCSAYLLTDVGMDTIYLDDLFLEIPGPRRSTLHWRVGVNYFCAQADRRWWHDHRIPGGMAFSMNSVGHLVKSRAAARSMEDLEKALGLEGGEWVKSKIDSLEQALIFAMRTIALASDAVSGKATELLPLPDDAATLPACPVRLPLDLAGKNHCEYAGYYHTDITLPSEYFIPDVARPASAIRRALDFTYLFHSEDLASSYHSMGAGVPIRQVNGSEPSPLNERALKALKSAGVELSSGDTDRLIADLFGR